MLVEMRGRQRHSLARGTPATVRGGEHAAARALAEAPKLADGAAGKGGTAAPRVDEEGFQEVLPGRRSNSIGIARGGGGGEGGAASSAGSSGASWAERVSLGSKGVEAGANAAARRGSGGAGRDTVGEAANAEDQEVREARMAEVLDHVHGRRSDEDEDDYAGDDHDEAADEDASPSELRQAWSEAAEAVRFLERRGGPRIPPEVLSSARAHRDAAEKAWKAAKPPHPVGKRLRWAAAALESALAKQHAHQEEFEAFEIQTARRRAELEARREVDAACAAWKQADLDAQDALRAARACSSDVEDKLERRTDRG